MFHVPLFSPNLDVNTNSNLMSFSHDHITVFSAHFFDTGARAISSFVAGVSGLISISKISIGRPIVVQAFGIYNDH